MSNQIALNEDSFRITSLSQGCVSWPETCQMMNDLTQLYAKRDESPIMLSLIECNLKQNMLKQRKELILTRSIELKGRIQLAIDKCSKQLQVEIEKLKNHEQNLNELQTELDRIIYKRNSLQNQSDELNRQIQLHVTEASQEMEALDTVEMDKRNEVPRLKQQLSLHATGTLIKWDYQRTDALAGELSIPSKKVLKRFSIDLNQVSSFEAANKIWDLMDE